MLLHELINNSENDENNNKLKYSRFSKIKRKLQTSYENKDEEIKINENEQKETELENGFLELGLRKPKRKIQITIFTQKNTDNEFLND